MTMVSPLVPMREGRARYACFSCHGVAMRPREDVLSHLSLSALQPPHSPRPASPDPFFALGPRGSEPDSMSILSCMAQYYLARSLVGYVVCSAPGIRSQ